MSDDIEIKNFYTEKEAFDSSLKYFEGDELAANVFISKYALKDDKGNILEDNPEKMHWRIANEFARIESKKFKSPLTSKEIFSYINKFERIVPQGSPMFGIGNNYQTISLSNCFVIETPEDSYGAILKTDQQLVQISKRRGGVGVDLSSLRPSGLPTKNAAKTSTGIVSWMERYSNSIREVGQEGRRGALMETLIVHHPDILNFATIKNDDKKVTGANISIKLTDEFLSALENDSEYELRFPVDYKERGIKPQVSKMVRAREVWEKIIHSAWLRAEPGLLFWDSITKNNAVDCYASHGFATVSTNPCQPAWAPILTEFGLKQLKDISIGDKIWSESGWTKVINKWSTGIKKVYEYKTTTGTFFGTENHRVVSNGEKIEAGSAESIDQLYGPYHSSFVLDPQDIVDGVVFGDGSVHKASNNLVHLFIGHDDYDYFNSEIKDFILKKRPGLNEYAYEIKTTILSNEIPLTYNRVIPDRFIYSSKEKMIGFLRGLYTANGSISGDRVTLKGSSFKVIQQVQIMLSSLGIRSYYTTNKSNTVTFSNGDYTCRESYDLNISVDKDKFAQIIGFIQKYKNESLNVLLISKPKSSRLSKKTYDIVSNNLVSEEEVFDITVDNDTHTYWTGGLNVSNCAELPLCIFDSCRLLIQVLLFYVKNPFTKDAYFDYDLFSKDAILSQRLMDDLLDLEIEKINKIIDKIKSDPEALNIKEEELSTWEAIKQKCVDGRRTGLGITGTGDTLAALGIKYGSEESIAIVEKIHKTQKLASFRSSVEMAKEVGPFPIWNWETEKDSKFIQQIKLEDEELYDDIKKYGRRNIANLTIAPAGSVSILTQTTSGIEPLFKLDPYIRRKKINPNDKSAKVDFVDQNGDSWQHFDVYHPRVKQWMEITGEKDVTKSPWFGATANDINWVNRVKLQAAAQKHIDHAISSTINLPETATEAQVSEIYIAAWKEGVKGITVYRDKCRSGVLIEKQEKKVENKIQKTVAPKRPKELPCDVHHVNFKSKRYYVIVGLLENDPYEVFTGPNDDGEGDTIVPKSIKQGKLVKKQKGKYVLVNDDKEFSRIITNGHSDDNADALTRLISASLRHGASIEFIVDQLEKTAGDLTSFSKIIARTIKKYIPDGTKVSGEKCPTCSSELTREGGCVGCKNCGWSKCS